MMEVQQITALREQIRQTARAIADLNRRQLRPRLIWTGVGVAVAGGLVGLMILRPEYLVLLVFAHAFMLPLLVGVVGCVLHTDAMSEVVSQRRARHDELVERLRSLPNDQVAATLLSLRSDAEADVRALSKRLLGEIELRSELAPATAPEPRTNEASPAETAA